MNFSIMNKLAHNIQTQQSLSHHYLRRANIPWKHLEKSATIFRVSQAKCSINKSLERTSFIESHFTVPSRHYVRMALTVRYIESTIANTDRIECDISYFNSIDPRLFKSKKYFAIIESNK